MPFQDISTLSKILLKQDHALNKIIKVLQIKVNIFGEQKLQFSYNIKASEKTLFQVSTLMNSTKLCVKNVAFEANKKEIIRLFTPFGFVRSCHLPKKLDRCHS